MEKKEIIDEFLNEAIRDIKSELVWYLDKVYTEGKLMPSQEVIDEIKTSLDEVRLLESYL